MSGTAQTSGTYNGAHEITSYTDATASMSTAIYDGDGLRTSSTNTIAGGGPVTQNYVWDTTSSVPQIMTDSRTPTSTDLARRRSSRSI